MAGYKLLKRKGGVDQVSDDFSDFSLSSPPTKIRRLDAELPPIAEVEEEEPLRLPIPIPEAPNHNQERALVLFKPLLPSPSFSLTLRSDLISEIKNQSPWSKQCDSQCDRLIRSAEVEQEQAEDQNNHRLALVPWVPSSSSQFPYVPDSNNTNTELMEADEIGGEASMMMDIEQEDTTTNSSTSTIHHPTTLNLHQHHGIGGIATATAPEGFHQWQQQQHCLLPQFPQNTSTPIAWT